MRVLDPGHLYELAELDVPEASGDGRPAAELRFVKRVGDKYPGNEAPAYAGVTTQEVLRALIERTKYVNGQRDDPANHQVLRYLRSALIELEMRAHRERGDFETAYRAYQLSEPELEPTCPRCGHVFCKEGHA